ncbi:MAG: NAD(P)/FAD-dependent oxidoreductase [Candidatus Yanofskybacteria bacterium]|nr:NAD(P)/FAD-dependent oxidoreductase [Candidatus Yanofskybacteria bacterium]
MTKILILGGGFGGVRAALDLEKKLGDRGDVEITLVDKNDSQTFFPSLYEVASIYGIDHQHPFHTKLRGTVSIPFSDIFKNKKINLIQAEINHLDIQNKHVVTSNGATLDFDYLVLALGSVVSTFGVPGADEYAFKFKTIEDGLMLNDKIEELYIEASEKKRPLPINILIGGAGFNGVELAAELSNCTVHIACSHKITQQNCSAIALVEAGPAILPMISGKERDLIQKRLEKLGINLLVNSPIQEIGPDFIKLKNGNYLKGDLIIWSGGVKALDIFRTVDSLELDDRGRIFVNEFLQTKNYPNIFAVGDNIVFIDPKTQKPIPQMAFLAIEQGRVTAENIARIINGSSELKKHKPAYDVWIIPVGGKNAVVHLGKFTFSGFFGYLLREFVDLRYFLTILPFFKALKIFFRGVTVFSKND